MKMNQEVHKPRLLRICFVDGTLIGKINLNGTYLHEFELYAGHAKNPEVTKMRILEPGIDYTGFSQEQYLNTIKNGLSRALGNEVKFKEKLSKIKEYALRIK
jgi:hypothetical protein